MSCVPASPRHLLHAAALRCIERARSAHDAASVYEAYVKAAELLTQVPSGYGIEVHKELVAAATEQHVGMPLVMAVHKWDLTPSQWEELLAFGLDLHMRQGLEEALANKAASVGSARALALVLWDLDDTGTLASDLEAESLPVRIVMYDLSCTPGSSDFADLQAAARLIAAAPVQAQLAARTWAPTWTGSLVELAHAACETLTTGS